MVPEAARGGDVPIPGPVEHALLGHTGVLELHRIGDLGRLAEQGEGRRGGVLLDLLAILARDRHRLARAIEQGQRTEDVLVEEVHLIGSVVDDLVALHVALGLQQARRPLACLPGVEDGRA